MKYYVIGGSTGEYSDRTEWVVCLVKTEEEAKRYVTLADKCAKEIKVLSKELKFRWEWEKHYKNPYDPQMSIDYTGTYYFYNEVEVVDEVKELEVINLTNKQNH